MAKYFGTDGIRGEVGKWPMTVDFTLRLASAAARALVPDGGTVLIGKDTRVSGYMFESALEAGFTAAGVDVLLAGPLPTPGIAYMCRRLKVDLGVVISASHNAFQDNGIKFFDGAGDKLSDDREAAVEALIDEPVVTAESIKLGRARRIDNARTDYQWFCARSVPEGTELSGLKVVLDASHGAGYKVSPRVLAELGADIIPIGCSPNGRNINQGCGAVHPELLATTVKAVGADLGFALDGDGDRVVMVDGNGKVIDGDQLVYLLATDAHARGVLKGPVVGTVMSNLGLEHALGEHQIPFLRAKVGDRNILAMLKQQGGHIGGETSGHIIDLDNTTTGDGLITALHVMSIMTRTGRPLAELVAGMQRYPQKLINVRVASEVDLDGTVLAAAREAAEAALGDDGRLVLRASGTEPLIRVMVEGRDEALVERCAEDLAEAVRRVAN